MATTHITPVKRPLIKSINYILNPEKTEDGIYTTAINCPSEAKKCFAHMMDTKREFHNEDKVQGHMLTISFKPGELDGKKALEVASEFANRYLGNDYEVLIGVHTDKAHIHAHVLFNSVSFNDGAKYRSNIGEYYNGIRMLSDQICKEHGLSIVQPEQKTSKHYFEWMAEQKGFKTWKDLAKHDIDIAIRKSVSFPDFLNKLENMGFSINNDPNRKHITIQPFDSEKAIRLNKLGQNYSEEAIKNRIANRISTIAPLKKRNQKAQNFPYKRPHGKISRFQATYLKYKYKLGVVGRSTRIKKYHKPLKDDLKNYNSHLSAYKFIQKQKIHSLQELKDLQAVSYDKLQNINRKIDSLRDIEKAYKTDFELIANYERLKVGVSLQEQGRFTSVDNDIKSDFDNICFVLHKRGYDNEQKIQTLSQAKAELHQEKEQIKEDKGQIRQVLKDCKNTITSYEKIKEVTRESSYLESEQKNKKHNRMQQITTKKER